MSEPREIELRGNVTRSFMQKLDACSQADGLGRVEWLMPVLEKELDRRIAQATVICRVVGINPTSPDRGGE